MNLGGKVKIKFEDGTKRKGVVVGWTDETAPQPDATGGHVPGLRMQTVQIILEPPAGAR